MPHAAALDVPGLTPGDVMSVFRITKSENRNEVHYGLRVDEDCAPRTAKPLQPYWRMHERGSDILEPLLAIERGAYGVGPQTQTRSGDGRIVTRTALASVPERVLRIVSQATRAGCEASAITRIADEPEARLTRIHVTLMAFAMIDHIELLGHAPDGRVVRERIRR
jgi:hypothetical protein